ncbi:hypothetical protein AwEntero_07530 [Enterobacterales bacterium]|nr:hypothetical protein AwEntero_07530 [Enterobacterales bacterium]
MTRHFRTALAVSALLTLAGCAEQNPQLPELKTEVGQLNQKLQRLTDLASALEQQTTLNRQSNNGLYILPAAKSPATLKSNIGDLNVSLTNLMPEAMGVQAVLHIKNISGQPLPIFTASLDWGQLDPVTGKPLTVDMQTQTFTSTSTLLPSAEQTIDVRLRNVSVETLGFIHLHHIEAVTETAPQNVTQP